MVDETATSGIESTSDTVDSVSLPNQLSSGWQLLWFICYVVLVFVNTLFF